MVDTFSPKGIEDESLQWWVRVSDYKVLEEQNGKLRALLETAIDPGVFGDWMTGADPALRQAGLKRVCEQYGFGAVLSHVEWLWAEKHPDSAKTVAACVAVRRDFIAKARDALGVI